MKSAPAILALFSAFTAAVAEEGALAAAPVPGGEEELTAENFERELGVRATAAPGNSYNPTRPARYNPTRPAKNLVRRLLGHSGVLEPEGDEELGAENFERKLGAHPTVPPGYYNPTRPGRYNPTSPAPPSTMTTTVGIPTPPIPTTRPPLFKRLLSGVLDPGGDEELSAEKFERELIVDCYGRVQYNPTRPAHSTLTTTVGLPCPQIPTESPLNRRGNLFHRLLERGRRGLRGSSAPESGADWVEK